MSVFSDTSGNLGIVQRARSFARVDSTQWPTYKIVNSANDWRDYLTGLFLKYDKRFQWDDTNHTALPEGTETLTINVTDYSFLTDQQGNAILSLLGVGILNSAGTAYNPLKLVDRLTDPTATQPYGVLSGTPTQYDKIADNIIRLNYKPTATVSSGIKFYFQRVSSYYVAADTTKTTGFAPILDRGFVVAAALDAAVTLGLPNINALQGERLHEMQKAETYFQGRDNDEDSHLLPNIENMR